MREKFIIYSQIHSAFPKEENIFFFQFSAFHFFALNTPLLSSISHPCLNFEENSHLSAQWNEWKVFRAYSSLLLKGFWFRILGNVSTHSSTSMCSNFPPIKGKGKKTKLEVDSKFTLFQWKMQRTLLNDSTFLLPLSSITCRCFLCSAKDGKLFHRSS